MDFNLSDEQQMLRDSARRYIREQYGFESRRSLENSAAGWSAEHWQAYAEMGWLALGLPEDVGGLDCSFVDTAMLLEALGQGLVLEPYVSSVVLCGRILERCPEAPRRVELLEGLAEGRLKLALAHDEPAQHHQRTSAATLARRNAGSYLLQGAKTVVMDAPSADHFIVSANLEGEGGLGLFLVDRATPGLTLSAYPLIDGSRAADLQLSGVVLAADALLAHGRHALEVLDEALDRATLARTAEAVGAMETVLQLCSDYLKTRVQFGQPIGKFQALQHRMSEMFVEVQGARSILFQGLARIDAAPQARARAVSAAQVVVSHAGRFVGAQGIQLHGGMGMTDECAVGHYFKRLVTIEKSYGDADWHLRRFQQISAEGG
jgi:alkylation response protein AidB-like acyl-CoA dehydrogenase